MIVPLETKSVLHAYVIPNILSEEESIPEKKLFKIIEKENITIDLNKLENLIMLDTLLYFAKILIKKKRVRVSKNMQILS